jgi:hypothetical protein
MIKEDGIGQRRRLAVMLELVAELKHDHHYKKKNPIVLKGKALEVYSLLCKNQYNHEFRIGLKLKPKIRVLERNFSHFPSIYFFEFSWLRIFKYILTIIS